MATQQWALWKPSEKAKVILHLHPNVSKEKLSKTFRDLYSPLWFYFVIEISQRSPARIKWPTFQLIMHGALSSVVYHQPEQPSLQIFELKKAVLKICMAVHKI